MEVVVHDVTEQILERLPPKSLFRFKSVSKQWKSTIESPFFQDKHLTHHRQNPDLFLITINDKVKKSMMTLELESLISNNIPIPWENNLSIFCQYSIDGLICLYNYYNSVIIFNPATRWYRILPPSNYQQRDCFREFSSFGFGKDQINGIYKPVWLYNSNNTTTKCEVFDFKINTWRFVEPSSPKRIRDWDNPVYINGLLYWLTEVKDEEISSIVLSLDLRTETFEIVCKTPCKYMVLYNLNDNLCGSDGMLHGKVIWSLNLEEKTWKKLYNIDLLKICPFFGRCWCTVSPIAFMEEKKKLMLFSYCCCFGIWKQRLMIYDHETTSSHEVSAHSFTKSVCYFQSLISMV